MYSPLDQEGKMNAVSSARSYGEPIKAA